MIPLVTELGKVNVWLVSAMTTCILILPNSPELGGLENASDASASGEMYVFNPSSTTFTTHFMSRANSLSEYPGSTDNYVAGYVNSTSAVTGIRWHVVSSGTLSGTFLLYGLKDS